MREKNYLWKRLKIFALFQGRKGYVLWVNNDYSSWILKSTYLKCVPSNLKENYKITMLSVAFKYEIFIVAIVKTPPINVWCILVYLLLCLCARGFMPGTAK